MNEVSTPRFHVPVEIQGQNLPNSLDFLATKIDSSDDEVECDRPIFLLASGWRTGSTLLQRLICSSKEVMMWGEPFGDRIPVCRMASMVDGFNPNDGHLRYEVENFSEDFSSQWIANMNPGLNSMRNAHLAFFETLLAVPAVREGYDRWGAKFVRVSGYHAFYLKWLYPNARFVFLIRHPLASFESYKGKKWYTLKPSHRVSSFRTFLNHWKFIVSSFLQVRSSLGALVLKYEDIIQDGHAISQIEEYLQIEIDRTQLKRKIGSRAGKKNISGLDKLLLFLTNRRLCKEMNYSIFDF